MNSRKTKKELLEMIEEKEADIKSLHEEIDKLEKYKQYDDSAGEIKALYDSFVNAGFNNDQAFELIRILVSNGTRKTGLLG